MPKAITMPFLGPFHGTAQAVIGGAFAQAGAFALRFRRRLSRPAGVAVRCCRAPGGVSAWLAEAQVLFRVISWQPRVQVVWNHKILRSSKVTAWSRNTLGYYRHLIIYRILYRQCHEMWSWIHYGCISCHTCKTDLIWSNFYLILKIYICAVLLFWCWLRTLFGWICRPSPAQGTIDLPSPAVCLGGLPTALLHILGARNQTRDITRICHKIFCVCARGAFQLLIFAAKTWADRLGCPRRHLPFLLDAFCELSPAHRLRSISVFRPAAKSLHFLPLMETK